MKNWFYESNGMACGPVSQVELLRLMISGKIRPQTLVWTASFGDQWRTADQAGLTNLAARIGTLGRFGRPAVGAKTPIRVQVVDPSAPKKPVPFMWAWTLLLLPSGLSIIISLFSNVLSQPGTENSVVTFVLCMIFFLALSMDRRSLLDAGYHPPSFWWWLFLPGYFIERLRSTHKGALLTGLSILFAIIAITQVVWHPSTQKINDMIFHVTHSRTIQLPVHDDPADNGDDGELSV